MIQQASRKVDESIARHPQLNLSFLNLIIPGALILLYSGSFALLTFLLSSHVIFKNVNIFYSLYLLTLSFLSVLLALPVLVILRKVGLLQHLPHSPHICGVTAGLWIALLPLAAVTRYLLANQDILSLLDVIAVLVACLSVSFVLVVIIPVFLARYSSFRLLVSLAGAFVFTIMNMASISGLLYWLEMGNPIIQLSLFVATGAIIWLLLGLKNEKELSLVVIAFIMGSVAIQLMALDETSSVNATRDALHKSQLAELMADKYPIDTPNIYLLVYESYVPNETMLAYGIDNSAQENFLIDQGFTLYPHNYSVGPHTLASMNRTFNVTLAPSRPNRHGVSGDGVVHDLLRSLDYRVLGIFPYDYMFRGVGPHYDDYIPEEGDIVPSYELLLSAIWMGEFRYEIGLETISNEEYVQAKREVFAAPGGEPIFLYTHSRFPGHTQDSGVCQQNETEQYAIDLRKANEEMRQDVAAIVAHDPDAIVIVAGDHGPYLTKNCTRLRNHYDLAEITRLDLQDRYGSFLAVRWPTEDYSDYDQITVLQDLFPAIFSWMYRDSSLLDARIEPITVEPIAAGGVVVRDGVIVGGADDGEPLYLSGD